MLQLGTSADMIVLALVTFVSVGWPALITGAILGWRFSMVIEMLVITLIGTVATSAWVHLSGFVSLFDTPSMVTIATANYFFGGAVGTLAQIARRSLRRRPT